jgi:hypothetical protein
MESSLFSAYTIIRQYEHVRYYNIRAVTHRYNAVYRFIALHRFIAL